MSDDKETLHFWLALLHAPGIGAVRFHELLNACGSIEALFQGKLSTDLPERLRGYLRKPDWEAVEKTLAWQQQEDCRILTFGDANYPVLLRQLADAPPLLFLRGDPQQLENPQLAVVGSRNPSIIGRETAYDFSHALAGAGLGITSGLALGIDAAAHRGALAGGGQTLAVFGTGLDRVYPASHRDLAHAIVEQGGLLVSEYPPGTAPLPGNFPRRNRIISGLALGTLVVEAALRSGSLITARLAAEQGREVFAIPGSIHNPLARGCHQLIRQGAKLVETAEDVLVELAPQLQAAINLPDAQASVPAGSGDGLDEEYRRLLTCLDEVPSSVDQLVVRSGLTADAVSSMLLLLELQGHVISTAGGYVLAGKRL